MTLEEIQNEIRKLMLKKSNSKEDYERMDYLRMQEERMLKRFHFHFDKHLSVSQIQLFAKVFKCFINGPYVLEDRHLVQLVLPQQCKDVDELKDIARKASFVDLFFVTTPDYKCLEYTTAYNKQIPDMWVSLDLQTLQDNYQKIRDFSSQQDIYALVDSMVTSYTLSNSSIGHHLFFGKYDLGGYRFRDKVAPNIAYIDILRRLRSSIYIACEKKEDKSLYVFAKYQILDFAYQCRYLSFWSCLIDVMSFPGLLKDEYEILNKIAGWFLENLTNPFVYHISCESNPLNETVKVDKRESDDNTNRIKVYITKNDDVPILVRFDLPHKGVPYVHLNIQKGEENIHYRLSSDVEDGRLDHVFDNLCESLKSFNFNGSFFYHSPSGKDREIIKRMPEYTAMMNLASYVEGIHLGIMIDNLPVSIEYMVNQSIEIIKKIVKDDLENIDSMTLPEVYCYADMILEKELKEK